MTRAGGGRHHVEHVMGMAVSIDLRDPGCPSEAIDEVVAWLHHVDRTFSTYQHDSPISAMGRGELSLAEASEEIREVLRICEAVRLDTAGAFDVFRVPAPNGSTFDPSGLVKGWAIERSAAILESHGCGSFCVNAGGDVVVRGHRAGTSPWRIGVRHPTEEQAFAVVIEAADRLAIATSALYERGAHIVDPRTDRSPTTLASATVVGPDLTLADAYATAVFVMGLSGLEWIEDRRGYDAYVITNDDQTHWTPGFARHRLSHRSPDAEG